MRSLGLALLSLGMSSGASLAAVVTVHFAGAITDGINGPIPSGTPFDGTFTYDTATPAQDIGNPNIRHFQITGTMHVALGCKTYDYQLQTGVMSNQPGGEVFAVGTTDDNTGFSFTSLPAGVDVTVLPDPSVLKSSVPYFAISLPQTDTHGHGTPLYTAVKAENNSAGT